MYAHIFFVCENVFRKGKLLVQLNQELGAIDETSTKPWIRHEREQLPTKLFEEVTCV